jgi:hypothetical protein
MTRNSTDRDAMGGEQFLAQVRTRIESLGTSEAMTIYSFIYSGVDESPGGRDKPLKILVGAKGFEPSASWSRTRRASQAALRPDMYREFLCSARTRNQNKNRAQLIRGNHRLAYFSFFHRRLTFHITPAIISGLMYLPAGHGGIVL